MWRTLADVGGGTLSLFLGFIPLFAAQVLVLRRHLAGVNSWVLASGVGLCLGTYAQRLVMFGLDVATATTSEKDPQALGLLFGTQLFWGRTLGLFFLWGVVGVAQSWVLRRRIRHAGWWVLASALGGAISGAVALVVELTSDNPLLSWVARWGVYGVLTGLVLVLLLGDRIQRRVQWRMSYGKHPW